MNIYEANMFDSRKLNLRLITNALKLDKQLTGSYNPLISLLLNYYLFMYISCMLLTCHHTHVLLSIITISYIEIYYIIGHYLMTTL